MDQIASTSTGKAPIESNIKETIEAILVAFMLAFIFRAFIVEAFVIPTGSMAPTLLGAHMRFRCPDCGYRFDVNFAAIDRGGDDMEIPSSAGPGRVFAIYCPNCGYHLPRETPEDPDNDTTNPAVRYGDRILVLKFLYLFQEPKRWDVVVFKSPYDPGHYDYTQNYIKRLVGKPGESVMVLDGDVYIRKEGESKFEVQTKPAKVQEALWRIVSDNDFQPRGLPRTVTSQSGRITDTDPPWEQPWKMPAGQDGWDLGHDPYSRREFKFSNLNGNATLEYDDKANPRKFSFTDWLAYDVTEDQGGELDTYRRMPAEPVNKVSDVKLEFYYQRSAGDGPLNLELKKLETTFSARIEAHQATLLMDGQPIVGPKPIKASPAQHHVEFSNVDYRVSLSIDDEEILATTPDQYAPNIPQLLEASRTNKRNPKPEVRIIASRQQSSLTHIRLWRDIYYLNRERGSQTFTQWGTPVGYPNVPTQLGKDEFFVMGDNSYVSLDARYWRDPIDLPHEELQVQAGRVPRRFMLGKAFFVYWPAGFRPIDSAPALVPDVGDMRFIH
ncbi:MAG TPA: signal peptidase I [Tepidisphaeraceae bacterium]|nr:signal peptidase I [Tepidisphaeraceae bacterium]